MNTRLFCVALVLLSGIAVEAEEENCPSVNATFFYSNDANLIQAQRYLSGVHKSNEDFSIRINSTGVQALAFDYQHNESLFVAVDKPDTIWGVSRSLGKHVVVQLANASFDWITSDPATSNIYFADNQRGIGVCIGHSKNTSCAMLIKNPTRKSVTYKNLILYHQRGVMFFIQKEEGQESVVKMASMNGQHVRVLTELGVPKSITLNTQLDRLYVGHDDHTLKKFTVHNQKTEKMFFRRFKEIFVLNCDIHALEKDYIFDVRTYASKEQLKLKMAYDTLRQSFNIDFPSVPVLVVLDSDLALKSNPCKNFQCDSVCVLSEAFPDPLPDCIASISDVNAIETLEGEVELMDLAMTQQQAQIVVKHNPLNGFLLASTILLLFTLLFVLALVASPRLRLMLHDRIYRKFGRKSSSSFVNFASRDSTAGTNDI